MANVRDIDILSTKSIRLLSLDMIQKANSGHPGLPLGSADYVYILWRKYLKFNPDVPDWINRDRFILSAGHGSALLYTMMHLSGYDISMDDIKNFRQWGSKTAGHPEYGLIKGIETTTGPLGQGFSNAVGMAIAEKMLQTRLNNEKYNLINHKIYVLAGDGDLMEGISYESASIAGNLALDNLILIYDRNHITIDGRTDEVFTEDVKARFEAQKWDVITIDGHNFDEIENAFNWAQKSSGKPKLIIAKTIIGKGSPNKSDKSKIHGSPAGEDEIRLIKKNFGFDPDKKFYIPEEVYENFRIRINELKEEYKKWEENFNKISKEDKEFAKKYEELFNPQINIDNLKNKLCSLFNSSEELATRVASNKILQILAKEDKRIISGSADLFGSVKNYLNEYPTLVANDFSGRNIQYGIREHAMAGITNGITLYGAFKPIASTFLVFSDYMKPSIRMAALMKISPWFLFSHDSIFVGEDGATHQPVEHFLMLRSIPNTIFFRPADATELIYTYLYAIKEKNSPVIIAITRQNLPVIDRNKYEKPEIEKGAYIIKKEKKDNIDLIIIATGSEVHLALKSAERLEEEGYSIRVISMVSTNLFEKQNSEYKEKILPSNIKKRIVIEAATTIGWSKYATDEGIIIGIDRFGKSAPYKVLAEKFNITEEYLYKKAKSLL